MLATPCTCAHNDPHGACPGLLRLRLLRAELPLSVPPPHRTIRLTCLPPARPPAAPAAPLPPGEGPRPSAGPPCARLPNTMPPPAHRQHVYVNIPSQAGLQAGTSKCRGTNQHAGAGRTPRHQLQLTLRATSGLLAEATLLLLSLRAHLSGLSSSSCVSRWCCSRSHASHLVAAPCCVAPTEPPSALLLLLPKHAGPQASPPADALQRVIHWVRVLLGADHDEGSRLSQITICCMCTSAWHETVAKAQ